MITLAALLPLALAAPDPSAPAASQRMTPVVSAVRRATPSVLAIECESQVQSPFAIMGSTTASSQGSGVIIDASGVVLTNAHVVSGADSITAHDADGTIWPATILGLDADLDLAVLRLDDADGLPAIQRGDGADVWLGETVLAIGNPLGLGLTVSTGVVSSVRREIEIQSGLFQAYIQTDAAINPGNSGGALVNLDGELIGINTAIHAGAEGIGFAIPVDRAWKVARDLIAHGSVRAPWLGMDLADISTYRLRGTALEEGAVLVKWVYPGGPAEASGLAQGDLVYWVDQRPVHSRADLNAYLAPQSPGAEVALSAFHGTTPLELRLTTSEVPGDIGASALKSVLGIEVEPVGGGVVVSRAASDGAWARARLRRGDAILAVDGRAVTSPEELHRFIQEAKARHRPTAVFTIRRGRYRGSVDLPI